MLTKGKVLIVDDEADIRELLGDFLEGEGYNCSLAADAPQALDIFKSTPNIDLVMSDIRMPGKSGLELLGEIKDIDNDVIVVMISAVKDIESAITAMSKGAYDYVAKPFKLTEVGLIAKKAIEKRRLVLENKEYQKGLEKKVAEKTRELKDALNKLDQTYLFTLRALVVALDTRDEETQGHSLRVVKYTLKLADLMGIKDEKQLKVIEYGALLHDIGKIGIPDAILRKPGKLTPEEWYVMKRHPRVGYNILHKIEFLEEASQIVLHHHERINGSGYPDGLKGKDIPLGSRIFAVVDTVDAMTSERPYRGALTFEEASEELLKYSGIQFDRRAVEAFHSMPLDFWKNERKRMDQQFLANDSDFLI
ncbi:MAG: response regulator [Candidatus Aminicenantes bacterium]|nr:MAG: response regulator [Candidatus Aminicenantes bacterium]